MSHLNIGAFATTTGLTKAATFYTSPFDAVFVEPISSVQFASTQRPVLPPDFRCGPGEPGRLGLLVPDLETSHARALPAGAAEVHPPMEFSYRPRTSCLHDPDGNTIDLTQS